MNQARARSMLLSTLVLGSVAFGIKLAFDAWSAEARTEAIELVQRAAKTLGLAISEFSGPRVEDKGLLGGSVYRWERQLNGERIEELAYDSVEGIVCWSNKEGAVWRANGCITAR